VHASCRCFQQQAVEQTFVKLECTINTINAFAVVGRIVEKRRGRTLRFLVAFTPAAHSATRNMTATIYSSIFIVEGVAKEELESSNNLAREQAPHYGRTK